MALDEEFVDELERLYWWLWRLRSRALGLSRRESEVLLAIGHGVTTGSGLHGLLGRSASTMWRIVGLLEDKGLVRRCEVDPQARFPRIDLRLTAAGAELLEAFKNAVREAAVARFPSPDRQLLLRVLRGRSSPERTGVPASGSEA